MEAYDLTGECAAVVRGFVMGVGALGTGESFEVRSGVLVRSEKPAWPLIEDDDIEGKRPRLPGGWFIMAVLVNGTGGTRGTSDYLGLWQTGHSAVVATIRRTAGRPDGKVEQLLSSSLQLTSVAYFPALDTQAGRIGLVQHTAEGVTRLIGFDWDHRGALQVGILSTCPVWAPSSASPWRPRSRAGPARTAGAGPKIRTARTGRTSARSSSFRFLDFGDSALNSRSSIAVARRRPRLTAT